MRLRLLLVLSALVMLLPQSPAWVQATGNATWPVGATVTMQLRLGVSPALLDGRTWDANAIDAMEIWNRYMRDVQFAWQATGTTTAASHNGLNDLFFSDNEDGDAWGANTLAVTVTWYSGSRRTESDILFNRSLSWDAYRGALRYPGGTGYPTAEFRRVAMHELGHVLGLGHPDENGQSVAALMNSLMSYIETLTDDDKTGIAELYGPGANSGGIAPSTTNEPSDQVLVEGAMLYLRFWVNGSPMPSFQWYRDGALLAGKTADYLQIDAVKLTDAGSYTCVAKNYAGAVTSRAAVVTIRPATKPYFMVQPAPLDVYPDGLIYGHFSVGGSAPIHFQWRKAGVDLPLPVDGELWITKPTSADSGSYSVMVRNAAGSVESDRIQVRVLPFDDAPRFMDHPEPTTIPGGGLPRLTCYVMAPDSVIPESAISWYRAGVATGWTGRHVDLTQVGATAGSYTARFVYQGKTIESRSAKVVVLPKLQTFVAVHPFSAVRRPGETIQLSAALANGSTWPSYQWMKDGNPVAGGNNATLTLTSLKDSDAGRYACTITDAANGYTTREGLLEISGDPSVVIRTHPQSQGMLEGGILTLQVEIGSSIGPYQVTWTRNGAALPDFNGGIFPVSVGDSGSYVAQVSVAGQVSRSRPAVVEVKAGFPARFTFQPESRTLREGWPSVEMVAEFSEYTGTIHWCKNGVPIPGAYGSHLPLGSVKKSDAGEYTAVAVGPYGTITSDPGVLEVIADRPPRIARHPASVIVSEGGATSFNVLLATFDGGFYQWYHDGVPILGATDAGYSIAAAKPADAGEYQLKVSNSVGTTASATAYLRLTVKPGAPAISVQPAVFTVLVGHALNLSVTASGDGTLTYQWYFNGNSIAGATAPTLTIDNVDNSRAGTYSVRVSNEVGSVMSSTVAVSITTTVSRLINLSTRARVGTGADVLIPGFVIGGDTPKRLLIRAVGPSLEPYGIGDYLPDPTLELKTLAGTLVTTNDNWTAADAAVMQQAGAFSLPASSKDAAMVVTLPPGMYTAVVSDKTGRPGVGLVELYDLEPGVGKLINISTRARVGTGADVLIPGLVVDGNASKRLLIRAAGPALQPYGISDFLADPQMEIKTLAGVSVTTNDNWNGSDVALKAAFTTAGAFAFTTGSKDAALLVDLSPGLYTVVVRGAGSTTGVALVEVYEIP